MADRKKISTTNQEKWSKDEIEIITCESILEINVQSVTPIMSNNCLIFPKPNCAHTLDCNDSIYLYNIDEREVVRIISNLKNSKAKDIFGIDTVFLKERNQILAPVLTKVINKSINESINTIALKTTIFKPVHNL
ncbi:hypothetical protein XENORESO_018245 [Xenotaenia resolanae]|uniref:Uncharacterized protein n=1 Tax=Xenotaenia resolanae TaxID=208358 RepID=A0ABV0XAQ6_9TELE